MVVDEDKIYDIDDIDKIRETLIKSMKAAKAWCKQAKDAANVEEVNRTSFNEWISVNEIKLLKEGEDCLILFDTGEIRRYMEEDLPAAIITHIMPFANFRRPHAISFGMILTKLK